MNNQDCYGYIHIGLLIRLLMNVSSNDSKKFLLEHIDYFKSELIAAGFEVTQAFLQEASYIDISDSIKNLENDDSPIGDELSRKIRDKFSSIEDIVFAESITKKIYILPSRRFNSEFLINNPERLLANGVFDKLDEIARSDISSASRCLLFGEATAAARVFNILCQPGHRSI